MILRLDRAFKDRSQSDPSWFWPLLIGVVVAGAIVRVAFALSVMSRPLPADAGFFHVAAAGLVHGKGYSAAGTPTASHPPAFPALLAILDLFDLRSIGAQRIAVSIVTSAAVLLVGMLGRKVAGAKVGIAAAVIAVLDPLWFQPSGILMSESIYLVAIPAILLVSLMCLERPTLWRFGILGLLIAVATLIRSDAIALIVVLGLPVLLLATRGWRGRLVNGLLLLAGFALVLTPWLVRNDVQLGGATLSTDGGVTLAGSYCTSTFDSQSASYGSFNIICALIAARDAGPLTGPRVPSALARDRTVTKEAETFARGHLGAMPRVVLARELSVWGFGNQSFQQTLATAEGRDSGAERAGTIVYWILLPFVLLGAVVLARNSRKVLFLLAMPLVVVALNAAVFYGSTRLRTGAEPSLAVLGALGVVAATEVVLRSRRHVTAGSAATTP